jgi:hypothetical protein
VIKVSLDDEIKRSGNKRIEYESLLWEILMESPEEEISGESLRKIRDLFRETEYLKDLQSFLFLEGGTEEVSREIENMIISEFGEDSPVIIERLKKIRQSRQKRIEEELEKIKKDPMDQE